MNIYFGNKEISERVLIDSGSDKSYVNAQFCNLHGIAVRSKRHPYTPENGEAGLLTEVKDEATLEIGLGSHREKFTFDIWPVAEVSLILGLDWLALHKPDMKMGTTLPPVFNEQGCNAHVKKNIEQVKEAIRTIHAEEVVQPLLSQYDADVCSIPASSPSLVQNGHLSNSSVSTPDLPKDAEVRHDDISDVLLSSNSSQKHLWTPPTSVVHQAEDDGSPTGSQGCDK